MTKATFYIGLGANLTPEGYDNPRQGCVAALNTLSDFGIEITAVSRWYESAPVPLSDQPWYSNAVAKGTTDGTAFETLAALHRIETQFGRVRGVVNAARVLDLDLLDFAGQVIHGKSLILPHPRMDKRAFVLLPLRELAPDWWHPVKGIGIDALVAKIPASQAIRLAATA